MRRFSPKVIVLAPLRSSEGNSTFCETQARKTEMEEEMARAFFPDFAERIEGSLFRYVGYALIAGPLQVLARRFERRIWITWRNEYDSH